MLIGGVLGYGALFLWVLTEDKRKARKEGDMLEVIGRIGLGVCLCGYAAIVLWVWGWDKRKDRRERRNGESADKTGAVQQGNVSGAESGAGAAMCEEMALAKIEGGDAKKIARDAFHKGSGLRRTAELSVAQKLIDNARYVKTEEHEHNKFSSM